MDFHSVRTEVRRLGKKNLFNMLMGQKESRCILSGLCSFHFKYNGYTFCLSEILGEGCEFQRLKKLEQEICEDKERLVSEEEVEAPLFDCIKGSSYNSK